jgi:hypothetical protein
MYIVIEDKNVIKCAVTEGYNYNLLRVNYITLCGPVLPVSEFEQGIKLKRTLKKTKLSLALTKLLNQGLKEFGILKGR